MPRKELITRVKTGAMGSSLSDLSAVIDDSKRKRSGKSEDVDGDKQELLKEIILQLLDGIFTLAKTVASAINTRRVNCTSKLDIMARRLGNGRLESMLSASKDTQRGVKVPRVQEHRKSTTVGGTQTDPKPEITCSAKKLTSEMGPRTRKRLGQQKKNKVYLYLG